MTGYAGRSGDRESEGNGSGEAAIGHRGSEENRSGGAVLGNGGPQGNESGETALRNAKKKEEVDEGKR